MTLRILGGEYKGRILKAPPEQTTRPTQGVLRAAVFNICQAEIEGARFLDLFAGSGAMGLEALSRGAAHATFVEKDRKAAACIRENIETLKVSSQTKLYQTDILSALKSLKDPFDIIYVDPPYDSPMQEILDLLASKELLRSTLFLEERQKTHTPLSHPSLELSDQKRYGIALLSIFHRKNIGQK